MLTERHDNYFSYSHGELTFGLKPQSLRKTLGLYAGPTYIYDLAIIRDRFKKMKSALGSVDLYYAMKANSNIEILQELKSLGSKVDVVSVGEIERALQAGFTPSDIVFSGVGKTHRELSRAIDLSIFQINVESFPELMRVAEIAKSKNKLVSVALRLNPNISIDTHPYIATGLHENKFGIELSILDEVKAFLLSQQNHISLQGLSLHLGSQMLEFSGLQEALQILKKVYRGLKVEFPTLERFDFGGGLGIRYEETDLALEEEQLDQYSLVVKNELADLGAQLQSEPGRWIVAHAGVLVTQIQYIKPTPYRQFIIVDSGMNHLIRPALYEAYHQILLLQRGDDQKKYDYDVVGPICESADFFAKGRSLNECRAGDYLAVADAGAYGYSMANTYNLQDLPLEIVFDSEHSAN